MTLSLEDVPRIGMGTWKMGGSWERDDTHDTENIQALEYGLSLGYRLIDTAELYGGGHTEDLVGAAIKK